MPESRARLSSSEWACVFLIGRLGPSSAGQLLPHLQPSSESTIRTLLHRAASKGYLTTSSSSLAEPRFSLAAPLKRIRSEVPPLDFECLSLLHELGSATAPDLLERLEPGTTNLPALRSLLNRGVAKRYLKSSLPSVVYSLAVPFPKLLEEQIEHFLDEVLYRYPPALALLAEHLSSEGLQFEE